MASDQAKQSSEKSKGYRYDLSDTEIDQLSEAMPDDGSQGAIAYRNIMRSMKERDMKGRAALLFSLMQNKDYRPIVKKKLDEMQGIKDGQAE